MPDRIVHAFAVVLIAAALLQEPLHAQSTERVALVEQVTSASCGPCAAQNPAFNVLLGDNEQRVAVIKYQRGGGGYVDPMWSFNPTDVDQRIAVYYGTFSFPQVWINGTYYNSPSMLSQSTIDAETSEDPGFDIAIDQSLNAAENELQIEVTFRALRDFQAANDAVLRAFVVVTESEVNYSSPPGYNSEKDFYYVMRKMLPDYSGELIGKQLEGDERTLSYTYPIDISQIDPQRLQVVAFVQKQNTREVYQAAVWREAQPTGIDDLIADELDVQVLPSMSDGRTELRFTLAEPQDLRPVAYDLAGAAVREFPARRFDAGEHRIPLDLSELPEGIYLVSLQSEHGRATARFLLSR